jgi:hypothetical protein
MEQIATQLGVSEKTISLDLAGILTLGKNSKPAKTTTLPACWAIGDPSMFDFLT